MKFNPHINLWLKIHTFVKNVFNCQDKWPEIILFNFISDLLQNLSLKLLSPARDHCSTMVHNCPTMIDRCFLTIVNNGLTVIGPWLKPWYTIANETPDYGWSWQNIFSLEWHTKSKQEPVFTIPWSDNSKSCCNHYKKIIAQPWSIMALPLVSTMETKYHSELWFWSDWQWLKHNILWILH